MGNFEDIFGDVFGDYLSAYQNTSQYKDNLMLEIILRKKEFEQNLDDMWSIYRKGVSQQIIIYQKGIDQIKEAGLKVLRNSQGKHKIVVPK